MIKKLIGILFIKSSLIYNRLSHVLLFSIILSILFFTVFPVCAMQKAEVKNDYGRGGKLEYSIAPYGDSDYYIIASNIARITVLIDGARAKIYNCRGRYYIEGRNGRDYSLLITNLTGRRIKVSAAVDGLDVIDGRNASFDKPGYIINPYSNANIKGWRISDHEVASFKFGPISESYAMKMDRPSEIGVMSFGFFEERHPEIYIQSYDYSIKKYKSAGEIADRPSCAADGGNKSSENSRSTKSRMPLADEQLGTEFGERRDSRVSHTVFQSETSYPRAAVKINYASYNELVKLGVINGDIVIENYNPPVRKYDDNGGRYSRPPEDWRK